MVSRNPLAKIKKELLFKWGRHKMSDKSGKIKQTKEAGGFDSQGRTRAGPTLSVPEK